MSKNAENKTLRKGWTTGACATAASRAAYDALLSGEFTDFVEVKLPKNNQPIFALNRYGFEDETAWASIIKDAGDDPDVTHGAEIIVYIKRLEDAKGVVFKNGKGVGKVTKPGLPLDVGEPAINPMPRQMIAENLNVIADKYQVACDVEVTISIVNGEKLAEKTMNGRLGIIGGLSVLGTTGVVVPYSCSSWIHSIHRGIDVAKATGIDHIAACTGSTSEKRAVATYGFEDSALIDMGDFAGGVLKYLRKVPIPKLTLCGGIAKLCKLAQGEMDLHSSRSRVDFKQLAQWMGEAGGDGSLQEQTRTANTVLEVIELSQNHNIPLGDLIAKRAREVSLAVVSGECHIEIIAINRKGDIVGHAP